MSFDLLIRNGDLAIGQDGDLAKVEDSDKLIQDVLKILVTPLGSNMFYPWYGSLINKSLIGQAFFEVELLASMGSSQLQNSLETLQRLQQKQAVEQRVSPFEQIAAVKRVSIERNQVDPRFFLVAVDIATRALSVVNVQFSLKPTL